MSQQGLYSASQLKVVFAIEPGAARKPLVEKAA